MISETMEGGGGSQMMCAPKYVLRRSPLDPPYDLPYDMTYQYIDIFQIYGT